MTATGRERFRARPRVDVDDAAAHRARLPARSGPARPPKRVGLFMWNDAGGLIADYLMSRIDPEDKHPDRFVVGLIDSRALAADS